MAKSKVKPIFAILLEFDCPTSGQSYKFVSKGHKDTTEANAWLDARIKDGTLQAGMYFIVRVNTCARFQVRVEKNNLDPFDYVTQGVDHIVEDATDEKEEGLAEEEATPPTSEQVSAVTTGFAPTPPSEVVTGQGTSPVGSTLVPPDHW